MTDAHEGNQTAPERGLLSLSAAEYPACSNMLAPEVVESAEKRVGETIGGKWHLDRVIGVGGMAAVYEATHRNRNRVAIKLLHPALSLEEGTRKRFLREGYVANTIRHEGAVRILDDDFTEDGSAFLVMELLKGESVEERMHRKGGALDVREALTITEQVLEVLEAAHDQNVVHRDIKPDNLFLTEDGKLKVLDFGIARLHQGDGRTTKVGSFMGTPAFCAQEQARGRWDEVDHRTDLYSVGANLFTCVSGVHVHDAETSSEQLALAIGATARSLSDVMPDAPRELVELVDTALSYDKEDRFQSARAMRAAVQRVKAGLPVEKRVTTPAPPSSARTFGPGELDPDSIPPASLWDRSRATRVGLGVVLAALLSLAIFLFSQPDDPPKAELSETSKSDHRPPSPAKKESVSEKSPEPSADAERGESKNDPEPIVKKAPAQVKPAPTAAAARPAASPAPAPAPARPAPASQPASFPLPKKAPSEPSGGSDEGMFDKRF